jgi:hypothetical protein
VGKDTNLQVPLQDEKRQSTDNHLLTLSPTSQEETKGCGGAQNVPPTKNNQNTKANNHHGKDAEEE